MLFRKYLSRMWIEQLADGPSSCIGKWRNSVVCNCMKKTWIRERVSLKIQFGTSFSCFGFALQASDKQAANWFNSRSSGGKPLAVVALHSHFGSCFSSCTWLRANQFGQSPRGS